MIRLALLAGALVLAATACGKDPGAQRAVPVPMEIAADSGATQTLRVAPPRAWLERVSETKPAPPEVAPAQVRDPASGAVEPEAVESAPIPESAPRMLEIDDDLKPPIPRGTASLELPPGFNPRRAEPVELDIRIDESGAVSDAMWAGGATDSALVSAAIESALRMTFYPALKSGQPVAVWCRQRVELGRR